MTSRHHAFHSLPGLIGAPCPRPPGYPDIGGEQGLIPHRDPDLLGRAVSPSSWGWRVIVKFCRVWPMAGPSVMTTPAPAQGEQRRIDHIGDGGGSCMAPAMPMRSE